MRQTFGAFDSGYGGSFSLVYPVLHFTLTASCDLSTFFEFYQTVPAFSLTDGGLGGWLVMIVIASSITMEGTTLTSTCLANSVQQFRLVMFAPGVNYSGIGTAKASVCHFSLSPSDYFGGSERMFGRDLPPIGRVF